MIKVSSLAKLSGVVLTCATSFAFPLGASPARASRAALYAAAPPAVSPVLKLSPPESNLIWLRAAVLRMGSTDIEILRAQELCVRSHGGSHVRDDFCTEGLFADEMPARLVRVSGFFLGRTEVTVADYQNCVSLGRCKPLHQTEGAQRFFEADNPVTMVTWSEAQAYCRARGGRLPTEAEFERAARGSLRAPNTASLPAEGRRFPWGNLYNSHASNHGGPASRRPLGVSDADAFTSDKTDGFEILAPVGSYWAGRTPEGIFDLAGNAAEWVMDLYAPYPPRSQDDPPEADPKGPEATETGMRVVKGGHFKSSAAWLRGAARQAFAPETRSPTIGFRCAWERLYEGGLT